VVDPRDRELEPFLRMSPEDTYASRELEGILKRLSAPSYGRRLKDSSYASTRIGNTYAASVFFGIASLLDSGAVKPGDKVTVFSYGSGAMATM
jgi:3-hydroxy-3-methylglutaryl CoA synthase